jgi:hypothetical protein
MLSLMNHWAMVEVLYLTSIQVYLPSLDRFSLYSHSMDCVDNTASSYSYVGALGIELAVTYQWLTSSSSIVAY